MKVTSYSHNRNITSRETPTFYKVRIFLPITKLLPLRTFPRRYLSKLISIFENTINVLGPKLRVSGCTIVARDCDLTTLKLNSNYAIGPRGTCVKIPEDSVIFKKVRHYGQWELGESEFLATGLSIA
jgi:hypothetical protein